MMKEPNFEGACFFHILKKTNRKTKKNQSIQKKILKQYNRAYQDAKGKVSSFTKKWFILFILDGTTNEYYSFYADNIMEILDFQTEKWKKLI